MWVKQGAYHFRAIPVRLQPIHGTHLVCFQHATRGLVIGEELKYFVVSMFGTVEKKKKKGKTTIIILSLQYPEKLYDYYPVCK